MNNTNFWDERRGKIFAKKGGWVPGEAVYNQGYDMLRQLAGKVSYMQVIFLNTIGYLPEKRLADWLEAVFICLSWPDHRIWCNQIGSLAGTLGVSSITAVAAGLMANDSTAFGTGPLLAGSKFTQEALQLFKQGLSVDEIIDRQSRRPGIMPKIVGFARPIAMGDDRIPVLHKKIDDLGFEIGEHLQLTYQIHGAMQRRFNESMNVNAIINGFLLDQGLSPQKIHDLFATLVQSGILACWDETFQQSPESFFPLRCEDVDYQGIADREI